MHTIKQILRLVGAVIVLSAGLMSPLTICYRQLTTHKETEAVITNVVKTYSQGRRGRTSTSYFLEYAYQVDGRTYKGHYKDYTPVGGIENGDKIDIIYDKRNHASSTVSAGGGQGLFPTLMALAVAGYLFYSFSRHRREKMAPA